MISLSERKKRTATIVQKLKKLFPEAAIALRFSNNWELLVAVELSAQCTDKKVNEVTKKLFKKYRTLQDYVRASASQRTIGEFEQDIRQTGFFRAKTKNILAAAKMVQNEYHGKMPRTMANVVLGNAYGVVEGIAVDTHVIRLSQKLGLTLHKDPVKIERDLMQLLPRKEWFPFTYGLIEYGRRYCPARKHGCSTHPSLEGTRDF